MGDRTCVTLTVMMDDAEKVSDKLIELYDEYDKFEDEEEVDFSLCEINYGDLEIEEWAKEQGIPYSYHWGHGSSYGPGSQHLRFTEEGKPVLISFEGDDLQLDPKYVAEQLTKSREEEDEHDALLILYKLLLPYEDFVPLEWETQHYNKRIARTVNLLTG